jgi:hypothetical protein
VKPSSKPSSATFDDGDEPERCRARAKSGSGPNGEPKRCGQKKVPGYQVCRYHGAGGGRPIKHGRYSARLGRFREAYQEALDSGESLLDLRETLALLDARLQRSAERAAELDTPEYRERAQELYEAVRGARDPQEAASYLVSLGDHLRRGVSEDAALRDLADAAKELAIRQEKAWGVRLHAAQAINARDLTTIMARIVDIILDEAPDAPRLLQRLDDEIMGGGAGHPRIST